VNEEWRQVPGHPHYEVSSLGRVRSLPRTVRTVKRSPFWTNGRILRPATLKVGYRQVQLGRGVSKYVHELVCEAFHGPRPKGFTVSHLDGCKTNNLYSNLAWESYKDNFAHKVEHGTMNIGERQGHARLTAEDVRYIRSQTHTGYGFFTELARKFNVSPSTITSVWLRDTWRHI